MKIRNLVIEEQAEIQQEFRRVCRLAVDRIGGIRRFVEALNELGDIENEATWQNRLTEGRTAGFDVSWVYKVFVVTGDYEVLMPFFRNGNVDRHETLTKLAKKSGYHACLIPKLFADKKEHKGDTTIRTFFRIGELAFRAREREKILANGEQQ